MKSPLTLFSLVPAIMRMVKANQWDEGLDGDIPFPKATPPPSNLYPYLSPGTVMPMKGVRKPKDALKRWSGRLDYKRDAACEDPTYTLVCPATEALPCCPPGYTVCCNDGVCCQPDYFCVGTDNCCPNGTSACGTDSCCVAGSTCCNDETCCLSGYTCQDGQCINPQLSIQSAASVASVASVSSALATQDTNGADPNTVSTVNVFPNDRRIDYIPDSAWVSTASGSQVGSCTNGTKVTTQSNANFTFIFKGTDISLFIVPSPAGGAFTAQVDGNEASSLSSAGVSSGCIPSQIFSMHGLTDEAHELTVSNGGGGFLGSSSGTLEFNSIVYTGKGAFGTTVESTSSNNNAAVIGGSVGGVVGGVVLVGAGILFFLYRKKQRNPTTATPTTPATANQPMLYQQQPGSPLTPGSQPSYTPGTQDPTSPIMSQHSIAYTGIQPGSQPTLSPQPGWGAYQGDPSRPVSGASATAAAPLAMWVERARPNDGTSMSSDQNSLPPGAQASALYGAYHPAHAEAWNGAR